MIENGQAHGVDVRKARRSPVAGRRALQLAACAGGRACPGGDPFAYAIVRLVPRVERGERFNVGVVLYCRQRDFLAARVALDKARLATLAPDVNAADVCSHLEALTRVAHGDAGAGPIATLPKSERFGWLAAPSSTIIQPSEVHTGLSDDPAETLDELFARLVAPVSPS